MGTFVGLAKGVLPEELVRKKGGAAETRGCVCPGLDFQLLPCSLLLVIQFFIRPIRCLRQPRCLVKQYLGPRV